jgi:hypothetical protein
MTGNALQKRDYTHIMTDMEQAIVASLEQLNVI